MPVNGKSLVSGDASEHGEFYDPDDTYWNPNTTPGQDYKRMDLVKSQRPSARGSIPLASHSLQIISGDPTAKFSELTNTDEFYDARSTRAASVRSVASVRSDAFVDAQGSLGAAPTFDDDDETVIDFLKDDYREMTNGRRIALWMMSRFRWYNPQLVPPAKAATDNNDNNNENDGVGASEAGNEDEAKGEQVLDGGKFRSADFGYPITHSRKQTPSLERAWAYFDHVALPRYVFAPKDGKPTTNIFLRILHRFQKGDKQLQRAEPGESRLPTKLYRPIWTPHGQLGDFGLGIGLYFSTQRSLTWMLIICGLLQIPNFIYFSGPDYSSGQAGVEPLLKGSAICTESQWVVCPTCTEDDFAIQDTAFLQQTLPDGTNATFAKRNLCKGATLEQGMWHYATLIFVLLFGIYLNIYLNRMITSYDEDEQTSQDYSVVVDNPPQDATDPKEWRDFFEKAFDCHVTGCTVAVDNDLLVRTLVERREKMKMLELMVEPGTALNAVTLAGIAAKIERERNFFQRLVAMMSPGFPEIFARVAVLTAKIQGLAQQDYPVTNVFITFETEKAQRDALTAMSVGQMAIDMNKASSLRDQQYLFRGFRVLSVHEPDEPDTIRWQDLNVKFPSRAKQLLMTILSTLIILVGVGVTIFFVNLWNYLASSFAIAFFNAVFPMFAKFLTSVEAHPSYGQVQASLYFKIAVFRWVTTAIIITMITPFTSTLINRDGGLILQIQAQFIAEITVTGALQLADPVGHLQRHFLAPRAATQDAMNLKMQGSSFELAERYTATSKLLFLAFWFCAIYPGAFFMCAFALTCNYFLDRISLMRTWKRAPRLGTTISELNRNYFFPTSVVAMAFMSSYWWASFPYDNICKDDNSFAGEQYAGPWSINVTKFATLFDRVGKEVSFDFTIDPNQPTYSYCNQDFLQFTRERNFPFIPELQGDLTWMDDAQSTVTTIYGWSAVAVILLFLVFIVYQSVMWFCSYFSGGYTPTGDDQGQNFSQLDSISLYIPQVESQVFSYPLLACNIDSVDPDMLDWTDPDRPHAFYDLTKDAQALIAGSDMSHKVVFSQVAHWPPGERKH